jgi:hypothetical protein
MFAKTKQPKLKKPKATARVVMFRKALASISSDDEGTDADSSFLSPAYSSILMLAPPLSISSSNSSSSSSTSTVDPNLEKVRAKILKTRQQLMKDILRDFDTWAAEQLTSASTSSSSSSSSSSSLPAAADPLYMTFPPAEDVEDKQGDEDKEQDSGAESESEQDSSQDESSNSSSS